MELGLTEFGWDRLRANDAAITYAESVRFEAIGHPLRFNDYKSASFWLDEKDYFTLHAMFGHAFMIGLLRYYEGVEDYTRCAEIVAGIKYMSKVSKTDFSTTNYE